MTLHQINQYIRIGFLIVILAVTCSCDSKEQIKKDKIESFELQSDIGRLLYEKSILKSIQLQDSVFSVKDITDKADSIYKIEIEKSIKQIYK